MPKIILTGYIIIPETELSVVKTQLPKHIELTRRERGCLLFDVVASSDNPCRLEVYEEFVDQRAFDAHQLRVATSTWAKVTKNAKRHYQITEA